MTVINAKQLIEFLGDKVLAVKGSVAGHSFSRLSDLEKMDKDALDWIPLGASEKTRKAEQSKAKIVIVDENVVYTSVAESLNKLYIVVADPKVTIAEIGNHFFKKRLIGIDPTAVIMDGAEIGAGVYIGPHAVVHGCVTLGEGVVIKAGAVIGNDGFGFEYDQNGNRFRFPQLGRVVIGNNVEIGSNVCIDRGALSDTIIGDYVKINNLVHIAHNVRVGANTVITAQVNLSGSSVIGQRVWIGPGSVIRDHVRVGDSAFIGMGSIVVKDIPAGEVWCGNPAKYLKST